VVAIFARSLLEGEPCTVYGDGNQTRDFVHVADVARAFVAATDAAGGLLLHTGTGIETTVNDLYSAMASAADGAAEPQRAQERLGEVRRSALDASAAAAALGWEPSLGLADGVADTLAWFDRG
jgi:UDP-glucose 4-epimerase